LAIGATTKKQSRIRINTQILAPTVRLVDPEGLLVDPEGNPDPSQAGVMPRQEALNKAERLNRDLVEISPNADPPVVRIMNFGKFLFDEKKGRKKQKVQKIKEIKLRPVTDEGDYKVKLRNLIGFLEKGDKVKVTIRFRGREITHQDLGTQLFEQLKLDVDPFGIIEQMPRMEGKQMVMMIGPKRS